MELRESLVERRGNVEKERNPCLLPVTALEAAKSPAATAGARNSVVFTKCFLFP